MSITIVAAPPPPDRPWEAADDEGVSTGEIVLYVIVLCLGMCCTWINFKAQILIVVNLLQRGKAAVLQQFGMAPTHMRVDRVEDPEIVWTNECIDPLRVDGSEETDELVGGDFPLNDLGDEPLEDVRAAPPEPKPRKKEARRSKRDRAPRRTARDDAALPDVADDEDGEQQAEAPAADQHGDGGSDERHEPASAPGSAEPHVTAMSLGDLQQQGLDGDWFGKRSAPVDDARDDDQRQARLEETLRQKQEVAKARAAQQAELARQQARRKLQKELLFMDHELDSLSGGGSHMLAAKWLLEHVYTRYPPPSFTKRRSAEEVIRARELRFRDATMSALKVLQARYSPDKNTADAFGAEWAVIAEEISKHAFSLCAGVTRGSQQELPPVASGAFGRLEVDDDDDRMQFSLTTQVALEQEEDVEDAD